MTSHTSGHETRIRLLGDDRLAYPDDHIEADNRLSWLLGRLQDRFGDEGYYVHLRRDEVETARSYVARYRKGIMLAYRTAIIVQPKNADRLDVALDYVRTVERNVAAFLRDKPHVMEVRLEHAKEDFRGFWEWIGAEGDLDAALAEWDVRYDATPPPPPKPVRRRRPLPVRMARKSVRIVRGLPGYLRGA
jgi:hypothetical protein